MPEGLAFTVEFRENFVNQLRNMARIDLDLPAFADLLLNNPIRVNFIHSVDAGAANFFKENLNIDAHYALIPGQTVAGVRVPETHIPLVFTGNLSNEALKDPVIYKTDMLGFLMQRLQKLKTDGLTANVELKKYFDVSDPAKMDFLVPEVPIEDLLAQLRALVTTLERANSRAHIVDPVRWP
jgi:hypothetical protein